jgi:hypothetical protein
MNISAYKLDLTSTHNYLRVESESVKSGSAGKLVTVSTKEEESLRLSADGIVQTKDKNISINLKAELVSKSVTTFDAAALNGKRLIDPLVINTNGGLANTDAKGEFDFDLDSDGRIDTISTLASGNGFLALDVNGNGKIDDGSELFGTKSGNGFADLAKYDDNKDGVIDESDAVFSKLKLWSKTTVSDRLVSLSEARVGALLLDNVNSQFELKNQNRVNAKIQKSGVTLFEDGTAGWVSHVDFAIHAEAKEPQTVSLVKAEWGKMAQAEVANKYNLQIKPSSILELLKKRIEDIEAEMKKEGNKTKKQQLEMQKMMLAEQIALVEKGGI